MKVAQRVRLVLAHLDSCGHLGVEFCERRYFGCRGRSGAERRAIIQTNLARQATVTSTRTAVVTDAFR